jgi:hypothetical protein
LHDIVHDSKTENNGTLGVHPDMYLPLNPSLQADYAWVFALRKHPVTAVFNSVLVFAYFSVANMTFACWVHCEITGWH